MLGLGLRVGARGKGKAIAPPTYVPVDADAVLLLHGDSATSNPGVGADSNTLLLLHGDSLQVSDPVDNNTLLLLHGDTLQSSGSSTDANALLLLHCDGLESGSVFSDSSIFNRPVSAVGNPTTTQATKVFGSASASFRYTGSQHYLSVPSSSDFAFGTGDFEIDLRIRFGGFQTYTNGIITRYQDANNKWLLFYDSHNSIINFLQVVGGVQNVLQQWHCNLSNGALFYELTLTKASGIYTLRRDGITQTLYNAVGSTEAIVDFSGPLMIGEIDMALAEALDGYIDELMISNIARHTADFTPATIPYGGNVTALDSSPYSRIVTLAGGAALDTTNKVFGAASFSFPTAPASASFLSIPDSPDWAFGTGDFEIDFRFHAVGGNRENGIFSQFQDQSNFFSLEYDAGPKIVLLRQRVNGVDNLQMEWNCPLGSDYWYELTLTRSSGVYTFRLNGVTQTLLGDYEGSGATAIADFAAPLIIGEEDNIISNGMLGNIDELIISNIARHTTDFTPSTIPYGGQVVTMDASPYSRLVTVNGGASFDGDNKVFGQGSLSFLTAPSQRSYLSVPDSPDWAFGTGDFEIDLRLKINTSHQINGILSQYQDANNKTIFYYDNTNNWMVWGQVVGGVQNISQIWIVQLDANWHEITLVKHSGCYILMVDGLLHAQLGTPTGTTIAIADFSGPIFIGEIDNVASEGLSGNIDELAISNVARHTASFTPATVAYGPSPTMLVDSSLYGKSVVGVGVTIDTTDKVLGAGSVSLRNAPVSDSYLSIPDSPHWAFGMGDFEIDFRVKFATFSQQINGLLGQYQDPSNYTALYYDSVNHKIIWEQNVGGNQNISQVWNYTFDTNWHEVTLTKASGTYILRVDGVSQSVSGTPIGSATAVTDFTGPLIIGEVFNTFLNGMNGSIDELLVLRLAKHTTDFTPATLPYGVLPSASNFFGMLPVTRVQSTPVIAHTSGFTNLGDPFVFTVNGVLNVFYTKYVDGSGDFPQIVRRPIVGDVLSVASYGSELAVLSNGGSGAWDSWGIRLNSIIDDGSGILKLYYTGCSTSQGGNAYWSIGLATSTDGGITWTKRSTPVLSPSGSLISVESASVLLHKGTYYMYHGYRTASQILPGVMVATSSDGIAWTEGDVILHTGNAYDAQYIEHHQILFYQGLFILLYESDNATGTLWTINAAYSPNPTDPFTKYVNNPIFTPSGYSGTFDITQVATPFLFQLNGVWYMFYQGGNGAHSYDSEWDIGIADF